IYDACFAKERFAEELAARLDERCPAVIGLSIRNVDNVAYPRAVSYLPMYEALVKVVRERAPAAKLVVGGSAFTLFPEEFIERLGADYGVVGEGEKLFVRLLEHLEHPGEPLELRGPKKNLLYAGESKDLDANVLPARDLVDLPRYYREGGSANLQTKRGCVYKCGYCTYPVLEGTHVREREPRAVVDEIEEVRARHGVEYFFFVDNVFNFPVAHAEAICEELLRRQVKISWTAYVTPAGCTPELIALMARSGCKSVDFGTDAASDLMLRSYQKPFRVKDVLAVSGWCHDAKVKFNHSLILGGPGETWATVHETVENIHASKPTAVIAVMGVRLYRNTAVAELAVKEGLVTPEQIGITPLFYVSEEVREGLPEYLGKLSDEHKNWVVPGLMKKLNERFFERVRAKGVKGPLWEML
ncbi:MAG: B12-binding domain-containing radical SAM protein, partial [Myxococcaceae bacterium]